MIFEIPQSLGMMSVLEALFLARESFLCMRMREGSIFVPDHHCSLEKERR